MDIQNINSQLSKYPITVQDKGWTYGIWYCGTSFVKAEMYGQHPPTYLKRLEALFPDCKEWLHAPSGVIEHGIRNGINHTTVDLISRKEGCPQNIADVSKLPFPNNLFDLVETDPPYSVEDSTKYGLPKYPRYKAMDEFHRVLKPDGYLCWLDIRYPRYRRQEWKLVGLIGIITGFERQTRILSIFQKKGEAIPPSTKVQGILA